MNKCKKCKKKPAFYCENCVLKIVLGVGYAHDAIMTSAIMTAYKVGKEGRKHGR